MKIFMIMIAFFFVTLAVVTAVETINSPKAPAFYVETRADRRKKARNGK